MGLLPGRGSVSEISTKTNMQLEVTPSPRSWEPVWEWAAFLSPPESVGGRPAGCRLPPRSASDESCCSSDKQHERSKVSETGNRYEHQSQMCKSVQWGSGAKQQKSQISGPAPPFETACRPLMVPGALINVLTWSPKLCHIVFCQHTNKPWALPGLDYRHPRFQLFVSLCKY